MKFSYQARTEKGEIESGMIDASNRETALDILRQYGLYPTSLKALRKPFWAQETPFLSEVSQKEIIFFTRQLAILSGSNIPIVESLETIARQVGSNNFRDKILAMAEQVEGGTSLSQALNKFQELFSPFYIGMLKAGEKSGEVPSSLRYLADYLEKQRSLKNQFTGALLYPGFILVVFFLLLLVMSAFVVPNFETVFVDMDISLPLLTRIVLRVSDLLRRWWWLIILLFIGSGVSASFLLQQEVAKKEVDKLILSLPVVGNILKKIYLSRIALNLSTLVSGGVSISEALEVTSDVVGNHVYRTIILKARQDVRAGKSIAATFASYSERFSPLFIQMTTTGEKTGSLDESLQGVVSFYEEEVERTLTSLLKFVEPALIIFLGGLVVVLGLSLFMPLFQGGMLAV